MEYTTKNIEVKDLYIGLKNRFCSNLIKKLEFTPHAWVKLNCYINLIGDKEITGFAKLEDGKITDVKIIKQEVEGAYVKSKDDYAIAEFLSELPLEDIEKGLWNLDWHSHVNMNVFASGTDWSNYNSMLEYRNYKPFPAMVVNKKGDIWCENILGNHESVSIDVYVPDSCNLLTEEEFKQIYQECKKDIEQKCELREYVKPVQTYNNGAYTTNSYSGHGWYWNGYTSNYYRNNYSDYNNANTQTNVVEDTEDVCIDDYYDNNEKQYCKCCGTELYDATEQSCGLCEDCANNWSS